MVLRRWIYRGCFWTWALVPMLLTPRVSDAQPSKILPVDFDLKAKGILLQVTEAVPVFSRADPRSAKLAEADRGTVLLAISLSKKKTWVQVEDDEGTRGWVPVERTDLGELLEAQLKIQDAQLESTRQDLAAPPPADLEAEAAIYQSTSQVQHVLGPVFQFSPNQSVGLLYSLLFNFYVPEVGGVRQRGFGGDFAWFRQSQQNMYEFRVRYTSRFSNYPRISYGPDIGTRFSRHETATFFMLGYRVGYDFFHWLPLELRGAVSTQSQNRWLGEAAWRLRF